MTENKKEACECKTEDKEIERKKQVRQALYGAYYESDSDRDYAIDSYTRSTLTLEEICQLVAPLKDITSSVKDSKSKIFGSNNNIRRMGGVF